MIYAPGPQALAAARAAFVRQGKLCCQAVVRSFQQAAEEFFTFARYRASRRKALRSANALERIEAFRRRATTRDTGLVPNENAVLLLLFELSRRAEMAPRGWMVGSRDVPPVFKSSEAAWENRESTPLFAGTMTLRYFRLIDRHYLTGVANYPGLVGGIGLRAGWFPTGLVLEVGIL